MSYRVVITPPAEDDVGIIYRWIFRRSPSGAYRWHDAWEALTTSLKLDPLRHPIAADVCRLGLDIREAYFKTSQGKRYRVLFYVVDDEVRILHVRSPGQAPMQP